MINIAIVAEEKRRAISWKKGILRFFSQNQIMCDADIFHINMDNAVAAKAYDVIFWELSSSDSEKVHDAFSARRKYKDTLFVVICDTEEYAAQGYEQDITDYLLLPISVSSWKRVLNKLKNILKAREGNIAIKTSTGILILSADEIYYVEVYDHKLIYHTKHGDLQVRGQFWKVQKQLETYDFLNCNRSCIVNPKYITSIGPEHIQINGTILNLSRPRKKKFHEEYEAYKP